MIWAVESVDGGGFDFEEGELRVAETGGGLPEEVAGPTSLEFAALLRGRISSLDEEVYRPIPMPMSNAVIAMTIGRAKRCIRAI
jgi:hypothetical protein